MSSGKTSTFGLNQWSLNDPFLMEEMNSDNRKIDAAVAAVPVVKLGQITTTADADKIDIDLSEIDWSKYMRVVIISTLKQSNMTGEPFNARLTANGRVTVGDYYRHQIDYNSNSIWSSSAVIAFPYITNVLPYPLHHINTLEIFPEDGCLFRSSDNGIAEMNSHYGVMLAAVNGSKTVAAIDTLQYLSYGWVNGSTGSTVTTKLTAGCRFSIFGVLK